MKTLCLFFVAAFYFTISSCNKGFICPSGWELFGESCYKPVMEKMTFDNAVINCTAMSGRMAVPSSLQEHRYISDMVRKVSSGGVWVGCTDKEQEGKWMQPGEGGEECSFVTWYPGEPNDFQGEHCAMMFYFIDNDNWADAPCNWEEFVVCQRPAVAPASPRITFYCLQSDTTGRFVSHCLTGHVIKELPIKGVVACGSACRDEPRCRSFNVRLGSSGENICQLNNVTRQDADKEYIEMDNSCYYFNN